MTSIRFIPNSVVGVVLLFGLLLPSCKQDGPATTPKSEKEHLVEVAEVLQDRSEVSRVRTGSLRARREVKVFTQEEGRILDLPFYEGDRVREGEVMLRLDDKVLRSEIDKATALLEQARKDEQRLQTLHEQRLIPESELVQSATRLEVAQAEVALLNTRLTYTTVRAPIDGVVSERLEEPGNVVARHTHVLTVIDIGSLVTEVNVSDLLLPLISVGDPVSVRVDALGEKTFKGSVSRIHPTLDAATRRGTIEVTVKPVPKGARPGQLCRVQLNTQGADRIVIPFSALRRDQEGEFVFQVDADFLVHRAPVRSGLHLGERVEILEGLTAGQSVVTKGFLGLAEGKRVKPVTRS